MHQLPCYSNWCPLQLFIHVGLFYWLSWQIPAKTDTKLEFLPDVNFFALGEFIYCIICSCSLCILCICIIVKAYQMNTLCETAAKWMCRNSEDSVFGMHNTIDCMFSVQRVYNHTNDYYKKYLNFYRCLQAIERIKGIFVKLKADLGKS